jgi:hypothetical protein
MTGEMKTTTLSHKMEERITVYRRKTRQSFSGSWKNEKKEHLLEPQAQRRQIKTCVLEKPSCVDLWCK